MNNNCMPSNLRDCPFCLKDDVLAYYHESGKFDLYYCQNCFGIIRWDGLERIPIEGEAYPNRDKNK